MADRFKSSEKHLRAQQAKEYLVSQIVEEAQKENVPLSEVERKMLYFTENEETLPDMSDVSNQFEREYDSSTYEKKISGLLHNAFERSRREMPDGDRRWKQAIADLRNEDYYLLVMVDRASCTVRPKGDRLKLWSTGVAIVGVLTCAVFLAARYDVDLDKYFPSKNSVSLVIWGTAVCLAVLYGVLWLVVGKQRINELFVKFVERVFAPPGREK
jgi:hypothetical protein